MPKQYFYLFFLFVLLYFHQGYAQNTPPQILIQQTTESIKLDGILDEEVWQNAQIAQNFHQQFPYDTSQAVAQTEIRLVYDENFLYVSAKCYDSLAGDYTILSLRRDFRGGSYDGISVVIDPFQDQTNGFFFGLSPYGVQREGLITSGIEEDIDLSWDNKWYSEAKIFDGYWTAEIAIPFSTLRFKAGKKSWNVNFYRIDSKVNERSTWIDTPRNVRIFSLAYTGEMVWDKPLQKVGKNLTVIPYLAGGASKNHLENESAEFTDGIGFDAKVAVTSSLNLDLTVNPDFSQIEVDQQVTNLDRFEIFFPERRQFFLENADLFANFGTGSIRPFFSRRIGVAIDTVTGQNVQNPILFGARLSGKVNKDWRVGFLNMQTAENELAGIASQNFTVAAVQRRVFTRSNIAAIFVNRQNFAETQDYNRLVGLEYNLASADNFWTGKVAYQQLFTPENLNQSFSHSANISYAIPEFEFGWEHEYVGENFDAEVGFVPRRDYFRMSPRLEFNRFPDSEVINRHGILMDADLFWKPDYGQTDQEFNIWYRADFQNTSRVELGFYNTFTKLFFSFDPTNTGGEELPQDEAYRYGGFFAVYQSDRRKKLNFRLDNFAGSYFNGEIQGSEGNLEYRWQPYALLTLNYNYNRIRLPDPYNDSDLLLVGPRFDFTFRRNLFLTSFFQYNNQIDNININLRLQWRFKPVSDVFLVYTDNYFAENLGVKNRAILLKVSYWLNL